MRKKNNKKTLPRKGEGDDNSKFNKDLLVLSSFSPKKGEATASVGTTERSQKKTKEKKKKRATEVPTEASPSRRKKMDKTNKDQPPVPGQLGGYYRDHILHRRKNPPENSTDRGTDSSKGKKNPPEPAGKIVDDSTLSMIDVIDVAEMPKSDAEVANWLALVLKDPDGAKCWQKYVNLYGLEVLKTGLQRLNKRLREGQEIRNLAAYLNTVIQSIICERQRER